MLDSDPSKSHQLYLNICEQLHQMNLIDGSYAMGEFELMRSQYQRALFQLVSVARGQDLPLPVQSVWPLTQPIGMDWSRYHREFDELAFVAGGGFGKVFKARHKLDGIEYAVKKIVIKSVTIGRILTHLAEVKTLASLNHQNVVAYKAAWLEPLLEGPKDKAVEIIDEQEITGDDEEESSNGISISVTESHFDESSEFIQFESSSSMPSQSVQRVRQFTAASSNTQRQLTIFQESSPHLNLKWATLYIQMNLCQLTLRFWMDERNKSTEDFAVFYRESWRQMIGSLLKSESASNLRLVSLPTAAVNPGRDECPISPDFGQAAHEIFVQIVGGLDYIHSRGIVHHDIKPSNVFIGYETNGQLRVQLGDFGLACPLQVEHGVENVLGTPTYAAPEQLKGSCDPKVFPIIPFNHFQTLINSPSSAQSDIFSLGVVLVELMMPFSTDMERIKTIEQVRNQQIPTAFPELYSPLLNTLIALKPAIRPTTVQILESLRRITQTDSATADELQLELDRLNAELQKLRDEQSVVDEPSPILQTQLDSKEAEIVAKNSEIMRLQRLVVRNATEMRTKDAEIRRLKAKLRQRNSSGGDGGES